MKEIVILEVSELEALITKCMEDVLATKESPRQDRLLTVREVTEKLGVSRTTLWRWEREHYLCAKRFGSKVRYSESEIIDILESGI